jgi:hypothetical protein
MFVRSSVDNVAGLTSSGDNVPDQSEVLVIMLHVSLSTEPLSDLEHYQQNFRQTWNIITRTSD